MNIFSSLPRFSLRSISVVSAFLATATLWVAPLSAAHLSPAEALARLNTDSNARKAVRGMAAPRLLESRGLVYVFSSGTGYVVTSADDCGPALLGYSDSGTFQPGANPALEWWLDSYSEQLKYASAHGAPQWKAQTTTADMTPIEPIVKTEWNQEAPYNAMCPKVNGHETVTGCVATAMAQAIRTHRHPYKPTGTHSYEWKAEYRGFSVDSTLTFDYDSVSFDFGNMPYRYDKSSTEVEKQAVAQLMLACGISVDMSYNVGDSGASTIKMGFSLMRYFKYDESLWMPVRNYYRLEEWQEMIYNDLSQGLLVLYSGQGTGGGHQFICDGYSSDGYFHFNWGWGGMSNGYFLLDALNPGSLGVGGGAGGFNYSQQITLNLKPAVEGSKYVYLVYCGGFKANTLTPAEGDEVVFSGAYYNYSLHTLPAGCNYGIGIISESGDTTYVEGSEAMKLGPLYGQDEFEAKWPKLADGTYTVVPMLRDDYGDWNLIRSPLDQHGSYTAVVADGKTTLSQEALPQAVVSELTLNSGLYAGDKCSVSFTVENQGTTEYVWNVAPALLDTAGNLVAKAPALEIDLTGGSKRVVENYVITFTPVGSSSSVVRRAATALTPGDYILTIVNSSNDSVMATKDVQVPVTMQEAPATTKVSVEDFSVNSGKPVTDKSSVEFKFTLECTEGYCSDNVYVYVFKDRGDNYDVASHSFEAPLLAAGESKVETADLNLSALEDGDYRAWVYYDNAFVGDAAGFTIKTEEVSGAEDAVAESGLAKVYDLQGRPAPEHPAPGLYIVGGKLRIVI